MSVAAALVWPFSDIAARRAVIVRNGSTGTVRLSSRKAVHVTLGKSLVAKPMVSRGNRRPKC
jgi:hypothetical protein